MVFTNKVAAERLNMATSAIINCLEGSFGVLVMFILGLGAILGVVFCQYRASIGCLVVAIGAFILRSFVTTFFNTEGIAALIETE